MNIIVTHNEKDYILGIKEAKNFCNNMIKVGDNVLIVDGGEIALTKYEAKELHRQIHEQLYV